MKTKTYFSGRPDFLFSLLLAMSLLLAGPLAPTLQAAKTVGGWSEIYSGVWYATGSNSSPLQKVYAIRVDTENPFIQFQTTPGNGGAQGETTRQTTPTFRNAHNLRVAINANYYQTTGGGANIEGLLISNGSVVSAGNSYGNRPAQLRITSANVASLVDSTATPSGVHTAIAGSSWPLLGGNALGENTEYNPRTGLGQTQDGRYLIMLVVDGRQPGYSNGATTLQLGQWLKDFGAWNGMMLDGGGSSTLVAQGVVKNSPSDGSPRVVGANFGFYAAPVGTHIPGDNEADNSALVTDVDDNVWFAAVKDDHTLYTRRYDASAGVWNSPTSHGTGWSGSAAPALVGQGDGGMWLIAVKSNGTLWSKKWTPGVGWNAFSQQGSGGWAVNASPAAVRQFSGAITFAALKQAGQLYHRTYEPATGSWDSGFTQHSSAWSPHATPCLIAATDGRLWLLAVKADGRLYRRSWTSSGGWTGFYEEGAGNWSIEAGPAGCAKSNGDISYAAVKASGALYMRHRDNGTWSGFGAHSTAWSSQASPSVAYGSDDKIWLFAVKASGATYHQSWNTVSGWTSWYQDGAYSDWSIAVGPRVTTRPDGAITWTGTKDDGTLYTRHLTGSWESFVSHGGGWSK